MILIKTGAALRRHLDKQAASGHSVGFIPTMGALHQGHLSLIATAKAEKRLTVCSIFVNPTQFNDPADFQKYPVTIAADIELLERSGTDILFLPSVAEIYPTGTAHLEQYDLGYLETILEGKYRPGHFQGVCQVMFRLLRLVQPDDLYMGQKDYQQCMVVQALIRISGFHTRLHACPTLRENDGLAMSSRNQRLNPIERKQAVMVSKALYGVKAALQPGPLRPLEQAAEQLLTNAGFTVDYVSVASAEDLTLQSEWDGQMPLVVLAAAYLNEVRLIDNMLIP